MAQAEALGRDAGRKGLKLDHVIEMKVDDEALVGRITGRAPAPIAAPATTRRRPSRKRGGRLCDRPRAADTEFKRRADDNAETVRATAGRSIASDRADPAPTTTKGASPEAVDGMAGIDEVTDENRRLRARAGNNGSMEAFRRTVDLIPRLATAYNRVFLGVVGPAEESRPAAPKRHGLCPLEVKRPGGGARKESVARIAGVNIPTNKRVEIALTYIHGIGRTKAKEICEAVGIPPERRVNELTDDEVVGSARRSTATTWSKATCAARSR